MASILDLFKERDPRESLSPEFGGPPVPPEEGDAPSPTPTPTATEPRPVASLAELDAQMRPAPKATRNPIVPEKRGDDLMAEAHAKGGASDEQVYWAQQFERGQEMIQARMNADPEYAKRLAPELKKLAEAGDDAYIDRVLDETDRLKIEQLKETNPELFGAAQAGVTSLVNAALFGQLSRLSGAAAAVAGGDYEVTVAEAAEKIRLLQKEYPKASFAGSAASFLVPGSPAKALFTKLAGLGSKAAKPALSALASNRELLGKAMGAGVRNALYRGAGGAIGMGVSGAADGALRGALGQDFQDFSFDRSVEQGLYGGAFGFASGGLGGALSTPLRKAGQAVFVPAAKAVGDKMGAALGKISGVDDEALRASRMRAPEITRMAGKEGDLAEQIQQRIFRETQAHPEVKLADQALERVPGAMDMTPFIQKLRARPASITPAQREAGTYNKVAEYADHIEERIKGLGYEPTKAPLWAVRKVVKDFQDDVDESLKAGGYANPDSLPQSMRIVKSAAASIRKDLIKAVEATGSEDGKLYLGLMAKASKKAGLGRFIVKRLGETPEKAQEKGAAFIRQLYGTNKEYAALQLKRLDNELGTNFSEKAKDAFFARQLGNSTRSRQPGAGVGLLPAQETGKAVLGAAGLGSLAVAGNYAADSLPEPFQAPARLAGLAVGGAMAAASSPAIARNLIGSSDRMTAAVQKMFANPTLFEKLATAKGVPKDVRFIAKDISKTLDRDGILSASSTMRLVADTPYFLPLVHHWDALRRREAREAASGGMSYGR